MDFKFSCRGNEESFPLQQWGEGCNMKKRLTTILAELVFITGLSLLLYPTVSN